MQSGTLKTKKKNGFFTKLKKVFNSSSDDDSSVKPSRSRRRSSVSETSIGGRSFGTMATPIRSRRSMFGGNSNKDALAEAAAEEVRKSKCMAIKVAKRDPPAVQRLMVDCEFCNPPPQFGRKVDIPSPMFTAENNKDSLAEFDRQVVKGRLEHPNEPYGGFDASNEIEWNVGLQEWHKMRQKWLTPTVHEQPTHRLESELTSDRYYTVFDKLVYQTRPFKHPLNLADVVQILKAGWVAEGAWPANEGEDAWSTSDEDKIRLREASEQAFSEQTSDPIPESLDDKETQTGDKSKGVPVMGGGSALTGPVLRMIPPSSGSSRESSVNQMPHVQFSESPHPRNDLSPVTSQNGMAPLSRMQSAMIVPLRPVRSAQSSVVSITDSE